MNSQIEIIVDELLGILESLVAVYKELNILGNNKKKILAFDDLKSLQDIIRIEEEMASSVQMLEQRRIALQNEISGTPLSLREFITLLDEPRKVRANSLSQELHKLVHSYRLVNDINSSIIRHLKNFLNHNRNVLLGVSTVPDYGSNGNSIDNINKKSFINRTI